MKVKMTVLETMLYSKNLGATKINCKNEANCMLFNAVSCEIYVQITFAEGLIAVRGFVDTDYSI